MDKLLDILLSRISSFSNRQWKIMALLERFFEPILPKNLAAAGCYMSCSGWYCGSDFAHVCGPFTKSYVKQDLWYCTTCYGNPPYQGIGCSGCGSYYQINCGSPCGSTSPTP